MFVRYCEVQGTFNSPPVWTAAPGSLGTLTSTNLNVASLPGGAVLSRDPENATVAMTLVSGALPYGVSIASNGAISGYVQPETTSVNACASLSKSYSFTLQSTDGFFVITTSFTITVNASGILRNATFITAGTTVWNPQQSLPFNYELIVVGGGGGGTFYIFSM